MRELEFQHIPAIARRFALDELRKQLSITQAELAKERDYSADLATRFNSAREELANLHTALAEVEADLVEERDQAANLVRQLTSAREDLANVRTAQEESATRASKEAGADADAEVDALRRKLEELRLTEAHANSRAEELATCRALADKCVFVVGFARSYTTITLEMLNCAGNSLLLGEGNFFLSNHGDRFSDWYNNQHCEFGNQLTKSSHAPDFLPERPHTWWQWLDGAAQFYERIGDKVALSDYHLGEAGPDTFREFYEARFINSRYIFMLRNPIEVLLSSAKMMSVVDDEGIQRLCAAWLNYMQMWADFVRVFPRTMTIICERFGELTVGQLEAFTGLKLGDARLLISSANKRRHRMTREFPTLVRLKGDLEELYADAVAAVDEDRVLWQAEQKRDPGENDTKGDAPGSIAMVARPIGKVWLRAQELRACLGDVLKLQDQGD